MRIIGSVYLVCQSASLLLNLTMQYATCGVRHHFAYDKDRSHRHQNDNAVNFEHLCIKHLYVAHETTTNRTSTGGRVNCIFREIMDWNNFQLDGCPTAHTWRFSFHHHDMLSTSESCSCRRSYRHACRDQFRRRRTASYLPKACGPGTAALDSGILVAGNNVDGIFRTPRQGGSDCAPHASWLQTQGHWGKSMYQ